jgi:hypothetical protein
VHLVEGGDCGWRMSFQYINDRGHGIVSCSGMRKRGRKRST